MLVARRPDELSFCLLLSFYEQCEFCGVFQGYLVIDSFFQSEELDPGKEAINNLVDELAIKLYDAGKIKSM